MLTCFLPLRGPRGKLCAITWTAVAVAMIATSAHPASIERLELGRDDAAVFVLNGEIVGGEALEFQRQLSLLPSRLPVAVVLNSPGGSLEEGLKLGRVFYSVKIPTFAMGYGGGCLSACALAFLGGRDPASGKLSRFKMSRSSLGFHQFRTVRSESLKRKVLKKKDIDEEAGRIRRVTFALIKYLRDIGESMDKLHLMLKAPSEDMNLVVDEQALTLGIHVMGEESRDFLESTNLHERAKGP
jgi:hypothetical protein